MPNTFRPIHVAILTVSDSRTIDTDSSGAYLAEAAREAGHEVIAREIVLDDVYQIRAVVSRWIAEAQVEAIITTGGTGVTGRDGTPEALQPLLDKILDGFGEVFRMVSYEEIGTSTIQSRAVAGVANGTYVFALPGSSGACRTGWEKIIRHQIDTRTKPCNLADLMPRLRE